MLCVKFMGALVAGVTGKRSHRPLPRSAAAQKGRGGSRALLGVIEKASEPPRSEQRRVREGQQLRGEENQTPSREGPLGWVRMWRDARLYLRHAGAKIQPCVRH